MDSKTLREKFSIYLHILPQRFVHALAYYRTVFIYQKRAKLKQVNLKTWRIKMVIALKKSTNDRTSDFVCFK